jgi:peptidyl-prolyl cis-trans isomerase D
MLMALRKHAKYFYVLFFIVILTFIFWGVGTVDKTGGIEVVAEVGKHKVTADEYWRTYDRVYRFYREVYKERFDEEMEKKMNLKENVLNSMINERILLIAAKDMGIKISDEEMQDSISRDPMFMKDGLFNKEVYLNRLRLNRITPELYESTKRQDMIITKVRQLIELSVDVTDAEPQIQQAKGNEQMAQMLTQAVLSDKKAKAVQSYIDGLKKQIKIKTNKELIS